MRRSETASCLRSCGLVSTVMSANAWQQKILYSWEAKEPSHAVLEEMMNQIDLRHRHAVVTGGGQGIGFAIASRLLASGASVSLWDRDAGVLKTAVVKLEGAGVVTVQALDVTDADAVARAADAALAKHGAIDILVANAGIA